MAPGQHVAAEARPAPRRCRGRCGQTASAQVRGHREPICEDPGDRGDRGDDAGKPVNGRQRHIFVETRGLLLGVVGTAARGQDADGAMRRLDVLRHRFARLRLLWADPTYRGDVGAGRWG
jgi:hypothetical protein